jgi:hypothetical protein
MTQPTLRGRSGRIPNLPAWGLGKFKKAARAAERVDRTVEKARENAGQQQAKRAELEQLERDYDQALRDDALEKEGQDPHRVALRIGEVQHELEALQRKSKAIRQAIEIATQDLAQLVQSAQEELLREADAKIAKAADRVLETALELQERERELNDFEHLRRWITEPERNLHQGPADVPRVQLIQSVIDAAVAAKTKADPAISTASVQ